MSKYLIDSETLTDIADAIREQTGDSNPIAVSSMATQISSIVGGGSHTYSETEQEVGTWIDGSTIYEKTLTVPTNLSSDSVQIVDSNFVGDRIISYGGYNVASTAGFYYPLPDGRFRVNLESGALKIRSINGGTWNGITYLTIQYTKASAEVTYRADINLALGGN